MQNISEVFSASKGNIVGDESLFGFCSVLFGPGEGTTCVPLEKLLQAYIGTSLVQCRNYFRLVNHGGTENHSFRKLN